jgi:hypothetical protein
MYYRNINPTINAPNINTAPFISPNPLPASDDLVVVAAAAVADDTDVGTAVVVCDVDAPECPVGVGVPVRVARLGFGVVATAPYKLVKQSNHMKMDNTAINLPNYYSSPCPYKPCRCCSRVRTKDRSRPGWDNRHRTIESSRADSILRWCRWGNRAIVMLLSRMRNTRFGGRHRLCRLYRGPDEDGVCQIHERKHERDIFNNWRFRLKTRNKTHKRATARVVRCDAVCYRKRSVFSIIELFPKEKSNVHPSAQHC